MQHERPSLVLNSGRHREAVRRTEEPYEPRASPLERSGPVEADSIDSRQVDGMRLELQVELGGIGELGLERRDGGAQ